MRLELQTRQFLNLCVARARAFERQRLAVETSDMLDQLIAEKNQLRAQIVATERHFMAEVAELHARLSAAQEKLRTLELIDMFARVERDWSRPLH